MCSCDYSAVHGLFYDVLFTEASGSIVDHVFYGSSGEAGSFFYCTKTMAVLRKAEAMRTKLL